MVNNLFANTASRCMEALLHSLSCELAALLSNPVVQYKDIAAPAYPQGSVTLCPACLQEQIQTLSKDKKHASELHSSNQALLSVCLHFLQTLNANDTIEMQSMPAVCWIPQAFTR